MDLILWRWSVGVQWASLAMIAVFFLVLERSLRLPELRAWAAAWACNLLALGITVVYWNFGPQGWAFRPIAAAYMVSKFAFALFLIAGAQKLSRPGATLPAPYPVKLMAPIAVVGLLGLLIPTLPVLGQVSNPLLGVVFALGGLLLARQKTTVRWLAAGLVLRAVLFFLVTAAFFVTNDAANSQAVRDLARSFEATHSFLDIGAEWLLALGCVLGLSDRVSNELRQTNRDLLAAQEDLRRLVDRDALTGLTNRRGLPEIFRRVQPEGALLLFFDLDDFKVLNDRHGHQVGDECLKRFALGLRECFRPGDGLVRYAGDEFLVVAQGLDSNAAHERVERLRGRLRLSDETPEVRFSVGLSPLPAGGHPDRALEAADRSMYEAKAARTA